MPQEHGLEISDIPAMKRRRMSFLTKMAFHSALKSASSSEKDLNLVFASQHGELQRTVKILKSLAQSGEVSPTDFSMSVHNTAVGLYSILTKNHAPATSVAAGDDSFGFGLMESVNLLYRYPQKSTLFVYFDDSLPEPLAHLPRQQNRRVSIALLLKNSEENTTSFRVSPRDIHEAGESSASLTMAESFLQFFLGQNVISQYQTRRYLWEWRKDSV